MDKKWDLKRTITVCLGGFWLLDGILQLQPAMFTNAFINTVLAPNLQNQPSIIESIVAFGIRLFSTNIFWWNLASALLQLLIGIILIFPFQEKVQRFGLWLSVAWAFVIWIFGEGVGNIFTGSATFYTGAPGSALLYLILALCLTYSFHKRLPLIAGVIFSLGAVLNLMPMFWQPTMLSMLSMTPSVSTAQELHKLQPNLPKNSCAKTKGTYGRIIDLRPETLPKKLAKSRSPDIGLILLYQGLMY